MQVSQPPKWWAGRREVKIELVGAEIDGLVKTLMKADTPFGRDLLKLLDGK